jgi:signal transduction histidine kinase
MVSAMGGALTLAGEPGLEGRGARFVVRLPRQGGANQEGTT